MSNKTVSISVQFGTDEELVTIRFSGRSQPMTVGLLGAEKDEATGKVNKVYLRSKIHSSSGGVSYEGWRPSGAISTILTRIESK